MLQCCVLFLFFSLSLSLQNWIMRPLSVKARFTQEVIEFNRRNKIYSQPEQMLKYKKDRVHLLFFFSFFTSRVWCFMTIIRSPLKWKTSAPCALNRGWVFARDGGGVFHPVIHLVLTGWLLFKKQDFLTCKQDVVLQNWAPPPAQINSLQWHQRCLHISTGLKWYIKCFIIKCWVCWNRGICLQNNCIY